ncbi:MAG TPA: hypothetical protein VKT72_13930 [Candidatus Baltobacteraceae bacterium]|nr:hypothetical protein [Candidatus Baltobacteraceae bacterium]
MLAYLSRKPIELQWGGDAQWVLGLSDAQIIDALQYWEEQRAIKYGGYEVYSGAGDWSWKIELTPYGRDLADGSRTISPQLRTTLVVQHIHGDGANVVGVSQGDVTQQSTVNDVSALLDALDQLRSALQDRDDAMEADAFASASHEELRKHGFSARASALLQKLATTLIAGESVLANAKPAYDILRAAAAARGLHLPVLSA